MIDTIYAPTYEFSRVSLVLEETHSNCQLVQVWLQTTDEEVLRDDLESLCRVIVLKDVIESGIF